MSERKRLNSKTTHTRSTQHTKASQTQQELATSDMEPNQRQPTTETPKAHHHQQSIITIITNSPPHKTSLLTFQLLTQHQ